MIAFIWMYWVYQLKIFRENNLVYFRAALVLIFRDLWHHKPRSEKYYPSFSLTDFTFCCIYCSVWSGSHKAARQISEEARSSEGGRGSTPQNQSCYKPELLWSHRAKGAFVLHPCGILIKECQRHFITTSDTWVNRLVKAAVICLLFKGLNSFCGSRTLAEKDQLSSLTSGAGQSPTGSTALLGGGGCRGARVGSSKGKNLSVYSTKGQVSAWLGPAL